MKKETRKMLIKNHTVLVNLFEERERLKSLTAFKDALKEKSTDETLFSEIDDNIRCIEERISETETYLESVKANIDTYIEAIEDVTAKVAASLYYRKGLSWEDVTCITGYGTADTLKHRVYRYMRKVDL